MIRAAAEEGHEIGLHAWDHHRWQAASAGWGRRPSSGSCGAVCNFPTPIGAPVMCPPSPAGSARMMSWLRSASFPLPTTAIAADTGFLPRAGGRRLAQPQVPVTLPTYDEAGRDGHGRFPRPRARAAPPAELNILTIHAEAEGIALEAEFRRFWEKPWRSGMNLFPSALAGAPDELPDGVMSAGIHSRPRRLGQPPEPGPRVTRAG